MSCEPQTVALRYCIQAMWAPSEHYQQYTRASFLASIYIYIYTYALSAWGTQNIIGKRKGEREGMWNVMRVSIIPHRSWIVLVFGLVGVLVRPRRPGQTTVRTGIRKTATNRSIGDRRLSNLVLFWVGAWLKNRKTQGAFRGNCKRNGIWWIWWSIVSG